MGLVTKEICIINNVPCVWASIDEGYCAYSNEGYCSYEPCDPNRADDCSTCDEKQYCKYGQPETEHFSTSDRTTKRDTTTPPPVESREQKGDE